MIGRKEDEQIGGDYEEKRAQRMKENMERMKQLGILNLSSQLKPQPQPQPQPRKRAAPGSASPADDAPPRRSSRLKTIGPVSYKDAQTQKKEKVYKEESENEDTEKEDVEKEDVEISIPAGSRPEVYTKQHEKLLCDSKTTWDLYVDGFDEEGERLYDVYLGKSCHQCRQKTLGHHTSCGKCKTVSGQLCGDCLCTRYGENVLEANNNADWICPVCREICNCNRCRRKNGWAPTGLIDEKVKSLGFKSVAHYLIQTFRSGVESEESGSVSTDAVECLFSVDERDDADHYENDRRLLKQDK